MNDDLSYTHGASSVPLIGATIGAFVDAIAQRHPGRDAVVSIAQDRRITYAGLR